MRKRARKSAIANHGPIIHALERRLLLSATLSHLPFNGAAQGVPGTIEVENYDTGGEGVSFHDPAPSAPNAYRQGAVDVEPTSDAGGGYAVGSTAPGEWFNYTVNVAARTTYTLGLRVACGSDGGGVIHVNVDGTDATGPIHVANTGGWQTWATLSVPNVAMSAGEHVVTLSIDSAAGAGPVGNFNWLQFTDNPATSPRTQWWRDAKFGMFVHWGLYSQLAGHWNGQTTAGLGEWIMNDLHIPLDQYAQVASQFDPTLFNAQQWVQVAKNAGMKYIVMTAKHHDGFSVFDTSVNSYNVVDATPWHQDPIAQVSQAARAAGLHFGAYYSIMNWADPSASAAGIDKYMVTMQTQLKELITSDHPDILWFDGEWPSWWTEERGRELTEFVRNLDPSIIINDRVGKRGPTDGDFTTPEQMIPTSEPAGRLWESCMTLNDTWGYKDTDNDWKSASTIVSDLKQIEAAGGNYLLNVGPTGQGVIPAPAVQILQQVGQALGVNASSSGGGSTGGGAAGGTGGGTSGGAGGGTTGGTSSGGTSSSGTSTGGKTSGGASSGGASTGGTTSSAGTSSSGTTSAGSGGTSSSGTTSSAAGDSSGGTSGLGSGSQGAGTGTTLGNGGDQSTSTSGAGSGASGGGTDGSTSGDGSDGGSGGSGASSASGGSQPGSSSGQSAPPPVVDQQGGTPAPTSTIIDFSAKRRAVYVDPNGNRVVVSLRGPGTGQVVFTDGNGYASDILLTGVNAHSVLSIQGRTSVGNVIASGALGALLAPHSDLEGNVTIQGTLQRLVADGAVGGGYTISADAIGSIIIGEITWDTIRTGSIGHMAVNGAVQNSDIETTGSIGTLSVESVSASKVYAGVDPAVTTLPSHSADWINPAASIRSFVVRGRGTFSNTAVAASSLGSITLGAVQDTSGSTPSGVAAHTVRSLRATINGHAQFVHDPSASTTLGDVLAVEIL